MPAILTRTLAQLRRITLLLAMISRPRLCNVAVSRAVLHDIAGPPDVPDIQKVRAEEAGATTVILMPNCSTSVATDSERASTANFGAP